MLKYKARNTNRYHLPRRHNHRKNNRSKLLNGRINEQLPSCRRNRRDDIVLQHTGVRLEKFNNFWNVSIEKQTSSCHHNRRAVHSQHHLIRVNIRPTIFYVNFVLPLGREAVEANITDHVEQTNNFRGCILVRRFAENAKHGHANGNKKCLDVLTGGIAGTLEHLSHDHHRDDFGTFEYRLHRKTDIPEGGILTPRAHSVAQRTGRECHEGGDIVRQHGTVFNLNGDDGHDDGEETVREDTECRAGELSVGCAGGRFEGGGHD
mmetsp:Transcript_17154/g.31095  ORF Transcript_17154/g.31095 Transcript_17154/m.31095 type:complete len:263 (-) Transcript_17154:382-1170(-)